MSAACSPAVIVLLMMAATGAALAGDASGRARILTPDPPGADAPRFELIPSAAENPGHFVPRGKHLHEFARANPATDRFAPVAGISYMPMPAITVEALRMFDLEQDAPDPRLRERIRRCDTPKQMPNAMLVRLELRGGGLAVPVFLGAGMDPLYYYELSLDRPGAPIVLTISGWNGAALRITTAPGTNLAAVHVQTHYASAVLGFDPERVTQLSHDCPQQPDEPRPLLPVALPGQKEERYSTQHLRFEQYQIAIGNPQPPRRERPRLGSLFDAEMPLPHSYGRVVLEHLGYIRRLSIERDSARMFLPAYEVRKPFRLPDGLHGGHAVSFIVNDPRLTPSASPGHSPIFRPLAK